MFWTFNSSFGILATFPNIGQYFAQSSGHSAYFVSGRSNTSRVAFSTPCPQCDRLRLPGRARTCFGHRRKHFEGSQPIFTKFVQIKCFNIINVRSDFNVITFYICNLQMFVII
jgi:hypothetical protein